MPSKVFFTPAAKHDLVAGRDWYVKENDDLAKRFVRAVQATVDRVEILAFLHGHRDPELLRSRA